MPDGSALHVVGPTSAQLCGQWKLQAGSSGSFTGVAVFWGDLNHSKATLEILGGDWFFEHTEMTGSGIGVMHVSGNGQTVLRRCITGGVDEEYRKAADAFVVSGSTRLYAVGCTLTHITRSAVKVLDNAQLHVSSSTVENCCVGLSASGTCKVALVSCLVRNTAPDQEAIQVRLDRPKKRIPVVFDRCRLNTGN